MALVAQGTAHGQAIAAHRLRLRVIPAFQPLLDRPHAPDVLLEFLLRVPIRLIQGARRLAQIMELAELMGHARQRARDREADGLLPVGDGPDDWHREVRPHRADEAPDIVGGGAEQAAGQQHLAREHVAQHPQYLMAFLRLQAIEREDHAPLLLEAVPQPGAVGQPHRHQLLIALDQIRDGALGDLDAARLEGAMDLGHAAVVGVAQRADQGDDVEAELPMRQRHGRFLLRSIRAMIQGAGRPHAAPHGEGHAAHALDGRDGPCDVVEHPQGMATGPALSMVGNQMALHGRGRTVLTTGHSGLLSPLQRRGLLSFIILRSPQSAARVPRP